MEDIFLYVRSSLSLMTLKHHALAVVSDLSMYINIYHNRMITSKSIVTIGHVFLVHPADSRCSLPVWGSIISTSIDHHSHRSHHYAYSARQEVKFGACKSLSHPSNPRFPGSEKAPSRLGLQRGRVQPQNRHLTLRSHADHHHHVASSEPS